MARAKVKVQQMGLSGSTIGKVIASIRAKHEKIVRDKLGDLASQVQFTRNVDEIMLLPKGVDKGSGIRLDPNHIGIDPEKTLVIGDGENDIDMFLNPGFKVAVANADPKLKEPANQVTKGSSIKGVHEIIAKLRM